MKIGFNNEEYVRRQKEEILNRISQFDKLYLEFGGKLFDDCHASRVLPGFDVNAKVKLLETLKDKAEIIIAISAGDIARKKIRADFGIGYDADVMRLMDNLRELNIYVSSIVITQYEGQEAADVFKNKMERRGERVYIHTKTKGYPNNINVIISDEGYGKNPYIETTRPLVVVTAPGPGSGKLATCLGQLYHEHKRGVSAGYAKFETFPIWNLPLKHPVNVAYEAATADLKDVNMIDHFHLEKYGVRTVNYNRDIEVFPIVRSILEKITGKVLYNSPTDMGVNMAGYAIFDDEVVSNAAKQEVIRRYYKACCDYAQGTTDETVKEKIELLMGDLGITPDDRPTAIACREKSNICGEPVLAIELEDGRVVTGKRSNLLSASSACVLNAIKTLANIDDSVELISPRAIEPIVQMKTELLKEKYNCLTLEETLIALCIGAVNDSVAKLALSKVGELKDCEAHGSVMLPTQDENVLKKLGLNLATDAVFSSNNLYNE